jgi:two-component system LytT family response regulator
MTAIIIEDEELAARNLLTILKDIGGFEVSATLESIADTIEWFELNRLPDVIFMDIHLADGSSFEIFKRVDISCPVIFTTAYDEYALNAFKVNSIDYLLKPLIKSDVQKSIDKLKLISKGNIGFADYQKLLSMIKIESNYKSHFLVSQKGDKLVPLSVDEIAYLYIDTSVVKAITFDKKTFVMDFTLDELYLMLNPKIFFRANRQYIISRKAIKDIDMWFNSRLSVNLQVPTTEKVLISKARIPEFKKWFE